MKTLGPWAALAVAAALGCAAGSPSLATGDASVAVDATTAGDGSNATDAGITADNRIEGGVGSAPFARVVRAWWIGTPDSPDTTVVYVFDGDVPCAALGAPGWDTRIADGTQVLEVKLLGTALQAYPVVGGPLPGPGEASVNYTLSRQRGTPTELVANRGSAALAARQTSVSASGSFDLTFTSGGTLRGVFNAAWCPGGHEP